MKRKTRPKARPRMRARAIARANIALSKYWGKVDTTYNLPAVPSLSLTLDGLVTDTTVEFVEGLAEDRLELDGRAASPKETKRVTTMLDRVRASAGVPFKALVTSVNKFPTASGLASSASGFAALAAASTAALGLDYPEAKLSNLARWSSASAGRSIFGGFAELPAGKPGQKTLSAKPVADADHWDVRIVVAVTAQGPKDVGSTEGMERSRSTSPFYDAWVERAPGIHATVKRGVKKRDLDAVGPAMEQSTFAFHSCGLTAIPIVYFQPATLAALATVRRLRDAGIPVYATMDAGPHVKALCLAADAPKVKRALEKTEGVLRTIVAKPGPGVEVRA